MKFKSLIFSVVLTFSMLGFWSCSDDDDVNVDDDSVEMGCADFEDEWTDVMGALSSYSENPNLSNCEAYKAALTEFYSEFRDCPYWEAGYQEALDEVQEMDCSEDHS